MLFHDCPPAIASGAARRLRRQHWRVTQEVTPLRRWPEVPSTYIVATGDRAVAPRYCRELARARLGSDAVEIEGGHSPFLARPAALASLLLAVG
jgi:pimeloyl-ACP methyl ester carboxylesterase